MTGRRVPAGWAAVLTAAAVGIAGVGLVAVAETREAVEGAATAVSPYEPRPVGRASAQAPSSRPAPPPEPAPRSTAEPDPKPAAEPAPGPAATPDRQPPGTVRLVDGGSATLVRRAVVDGVLPVPDDLGEATWWGADPDADAGATVLAGHVNWNGAIGPFAELWRSRAGDPVRVVDRGGRAADYTVSEILTLDKDELPRRAAGLFAQDGPHRLVLVTCGGRWVGGSDGYAENRIVIAVPVSR